VRASGACAYDPADLINREAATARDRARLSTYDRR
jgi:hypothetical protein